jgi:hypothetical protein
MLRFTIRDVLWLTVVAALAIAWYVDRASIDSARASLRAEQEALKAKRKELDAQFLRLVDATDELNQKSAATQAVRP